MKNFKELNVWKKGIEIVKLTYQLTQSLPPNEKFGLISQMTRAAVSIPANIAEESSRDSEKDNVRFLQIALGSAFELETYLIILNELNLVKPGETSVIQNLLEEEMKMLQGLIRKIVASYQSKLTAKSQ